MRPLLGLSAVEACASCDHRLAVIQKVTQQLGQRENLGLVVDNGQQDDAEGALHWSQLVELVEDDLRHLTLLEFHHNANSVAVGLVPQITDPLNALLAYQAGDALE